MPEILLKKIMVILKRVKNTDFKRVALYTYGVVILLVLVAMVHLLNTDLRQEVDNQPEIDNQIAVKDQMTEGGDIIEASDEEIQAVLAAVEGQVSVAIKDIEHVLPLPDAKPVWQQNAAVWQEKTNYPQIAIVIDDVGLSYDTSMALTEMRGPLTLSFLPYADQLPEQARALKLAGHELMVHLPMEPKGDMADPGPHALLSKLNPDELEEQIVWNLSRFEGYVGVNNHMGSLLTEKAAPMVRVMVHLRRGGYIFLDSLTSPKSVAGRAAKATGVPHITRDVFLDNEPTLKAITAQLVKTEQIARKRGYAIAIGHPYPETLKALEFWIAGLKQKKLTLVPLSQIVAEQEAAKQLAEGKN